MTKDKTDTLSLWDKWFIEQLITDANRLKKEFKLLNNRTQGIDHEDK